MFVIEKTSGSQRFSGVLYAADAPGEYVYIGASTIWDEPRREYGDNVNDNQIGLLRRLGPSWLVLELPRPRRESNHDWIELVR